MIEGIRPHTRTEMTVVKDCQDGLNTFDKHDQGRRRAPVIQACLDVLVHLSEHVRLHGVI